MVAITALGQKVRELRVLRGITQQRLAERAEVGHSLIVALESGRRRYVSEQDVERLAKGLGVRSDDLWRLIPGGRQRGRYIPIAEAPTSRSVEAA